VKPVLQPVVLFPDLLIHGLCDHAPSRGVLERWRDGGIRPALNRGLLERYVRALAGFGLKDIALRRWIWWFTSPKHSLYLQRSAADTFASDGVRLCSALAEETHGDVIYAKTRPGDWPPTESNWIAAEDFLKIRNASE
jgi:hypothetical protein